MKLGASDYISTEDKEAMKKLRGTFDLIISTISDGVDLDATLRLVKPHGALVNLGLPERKSELSLGSVIGGGKVLAGSQIGGIKETQEMLEFCAEHGINPVIEIIDAEDINEAYDNVVASKVRYRYVIDAATIAE